MKRVNIGIFLLVILSLLSFSCSKSKSNNEPESYGNKYANRKPRILVVHSYTADNTWTKSENQPINDAFLEDGYEFETFYMNITAKSDLNFKNNAGNTAMEKFNDYKPDIVVAADDEAQEYFASKLAGRDDVDIIFCGLEGDPARYNYPNKNVTGVLERPQVNKAIKLVQSLVPGTNSFMIMTDRSEASKLFMTYLKGMNLGYDINVQDADNYTEWKEKVYGITAKALILYKYDEISGTTPEELIKWTVNNVSVPTIAFTESAVQNGILLAVVESGKEQGSLVAKFVKFLVQGRKAKQIPISLGRDGLVIVNKKQAEKLKLDLEKIHIDKTIE